jgi:ATP-dependent RNA helicase DeaD
VDCFVDSKKLRQFYYDVQENQKISLLAHLLKNDKTSGLVMIFCNTKHITRFVAKNLRGAGINALDIHGGLSQNQRKRVLHSFHSNQVQVLVCTDVAARGLDIPNVTHVYNYNIPNDEKQYIHRIGRTARAEKDGMAVNLISDRDHENFSRVMRYNDVNICKNDLPQFERIALSFVMKKGFHGSGGHGFHGHGRGHRHGSGGSRFGSGRNREGRSNADGPRPGSQRSHGYGNRGRSHNWRYGKN